MIISFSVENYKSIKEEQTLNLQTFDFKERHPENFLLVSEIPKVACLKTAMLYGASASGKSNFFNAWQDFFYSFKKSTKLNEDEPIAAYHPFKLEENYNQNPVKFTIKFIGYDGLLYIYEVAFLRKKVVREVLAFYPTAKKSTLFKRLENVDQHKWFGQKLKGFKIVPYQENQFYLAVLAQNESSSEQIKNAYRYLLNEVKFPLAKKKKEQNYLLKDENYCLLLTKLLACVDPAIKEIGLRDHLQTVALAVYDGSPSLHNNNSHPNLQPLFFHGEEKFGLELAEETEAVQKMYEIAPLIIDCLKKGQALLIDKIDTYFSAQIVEMLVHLFLDPQINPFGAQLIFSANDLFLLNENLFRRDQIYFLKKTLTGQTIFTRLTEFYKVRNNTNLIKWLRDGKLILWSTISEQELREDLLAFYGEKI